MLHHHLLFISITEILFIVFVAFLLFGTEKLPDILRGLGKGYREFQKATDEIKNEFNKVADEVSKEDDKVKNDGSKDSVNRKGSSD